MTRKLYDENSFIKEFEAVVLECIPKGENFAVVLDKTAFFPEGGGQPSDKGFIENIRVLDVQIEDEVIYHITNKPFNVNDTVNCILDWERRFDFMQQHSAEHIVSGVAHSLYGCENVGFHLSEEIVTLDFDKPLSDEQLLKIEKIANRKVWENVKFNCYYPESLEGLNYRSKKELEGKVRIVEIENTDMCACCAPHVENGGQIGIIKLLDTESLRGGIRIELKAGKRALEDYNLKYANVKKISSLLAVSQNDTANGVERVLDNVNSLKGENNLLKQEQIKMKAENLKPEKEISAVFEENLSIKELQIFADSLYKLYGGIRAVFSETKEGFAFAVCGEEKELQEFFARFKSEFAVKGGGRNGMVQGNITASKEDIVSFLKENE